LSSCTTGGFSRRAELHKVNWLYAVRPLIYLMVGREKTTIKMYVGVKTISNSIEEC
jgi:hypothetical protein